MNENLSKIVADLFARSQGDDDLSANIRRLRDAINKMTERDDAIYGKFRGLLASFQEVIPEEKQRYHAAIKALSSTSKLSQQEIVKAANDQLEELATLEKSLLSPLTGWYNELKAMDAKSREMRAEISKMRDTIVRLEGEEDGIRKGKAAREQIMKLAEKAMKELFTDVGTEITAIKKKVEEFNPESPAIQPAPQKAPGKKKVSVEKKSTEEKKVEIQTPPAPIDTGFQKKCPMCGGQFNYHTNEKIWMCYTCAYEESDNDASPGKSEEKREPAKVPEPAPAPDKITDTEGLGSKKGSSSFTSQPSERSKDCPVCRKKMFWDPDDSKWQCPSCGYERRI